jgi:RNA polymerase sigma factor (sigma-70 family)
MTEAEFSLYVESEYDRIVRFVRSRVSHEQDAEELTQKTLIRLFKNRDTIDASRPNGFVFTALKHAITDYWRHQARHPRHADLPDQLAQSSMSSIYPADGSTAERHCRELLRAAVAALTPRERKAFLVYWRAAGDRGKALHLLGVADQDKNARFKVYDGPLHHAKKKVNLALAPSWDALASLGYERVWQLVSDVMSGGNP